MAYLLKQEAIVTRTYLDSQYIFYTSEFLNATNPGRGSLTVGDTVANFVKCLNYI